MFKVVATETEDRTSRGVSVERPRPADGVGGALRSAFSRDAGLPEDMSRLLARLDRKGTSATA